MSLGQPGLHRVFWDSQGYIERPFLNKQISKQSNKEVNESTTHLKAGNKWREVKCIVQS